MYQYNSPQDMHRLTIQQHISLEKLRQMIDNALRRGSHHRRVTPEEQTEARSRLRTEFAMLRNCLMM